uniref:Uncharacterized protein n=1 Tax=Haptolina brevifila TaxID=156173 RepID=A0A7S2NH60_9EUKA
MFVWPSSFQAEFRFSCRAANPGIFKIDGHRGERARQRVALLHNHPSSSAAFCPYGEHGCEVSCKHDPSDAMPAQEGPDVGAGTTGGVNISTWGDTGWSRTMGVVDSSTWKGWDCASLRGVSKPLACAHEQLVHDTKDSPPAW